MRDRSRNPRTTKLYQDVVSGVIEKLRSTHDDVEPLDDGLLRELESVWVQNLVNRGVTEEHVQRSRGATYQDEKLGSKKAMQRKERLQQAKAVSCCFICLSFIS